MTSASDALDSTADCAQSTARTTIGEPSCELSNFDTFFRTTHPGKARFGPTGRRKTLGRVIYECLHCPADSPWSNGKRGNAIYHARNKHASIFHMDANILYEHDSDIVRPSKQARMESYLQTRPSDVSLRRIFSRQQYIEALVGLLTRRRLPFSAVTWDEIQHIVLAANPAIEDLLLTSRDAAMRHISTTFDLYRSQLKSKLHVAVSKIHLSTDLWTSPHRHGILAVCARWVDDHYILQKALLAMPECRYSHGGERQAGLMARTIEEYNIARQIGYHTGDNATSNDTCLKHLAGILQSNYGVCRSALADDKDCAANVPHPGVIPPRSTPYPMYRAHHKPFPPSLPSRILKGSAESRASCCQRRNRRRDVRAVLHDTVWHVV